MLYYDCERSKGFDSAINPTYTLYKTCLIYWNL